MKKISVIVPVYNVERYLDRCLQSLLSQRCQDDIELILINDGSQDSCPDICDGYQAQHPDTIKVIHQENRGVSMARNVGLDAAEGEWLCFVDGDDWAAADMVDVMLTYAEEDCADVHIFAYIREYVDYSVPRNLPEMTLSTHAKKNYLHQNEIDLVTHTAVWGKLFKRSLIDGHKLRFYTDLYRGEDEIFLLYALFYANKVRLHSEHLYHYRIVASSSISKWNPECISQRELLLKFYTEFADKHFTGEENRLMKHTKAVNEATFFARHYKAPGSGLTRRAIISRMRGHLQQEPYKTAVKTIPLSILPLRKRWQIWLLRVGLVGLWFNLIRVADRYWFKKKLGHGYKLYP